MKELGSLDEHDAHRRPDHCGHLLAGRAGGTLERLFRDLAVEHGLDVADEARLFAMVNLAAADGAIACWNDKYYWNFWRPMAAIREADTDGNPDTEADPDMEAAVRPVDADRPAARHAAVPRPPVRSRLHQRRRSLHGAGLLRHRQDRLRRALEPLPRPARHFDRFSRALKEIIDARVWGGIHFRTADVQGAVIGKKVAHWLDKHYFQTID